MQEANFGLIILILHDTFLWRCAVMLQCLNGTREVLEIEKRNDKLVDKE